MKRISYSEFKMWKECPHRHNLVYTEAAPYYEGNEFTAFGTAIHKVCETLVIDQNLDPETLFDECFKKELTNTENSTGKKLNPLLVEEMTHQGLRLSKNVMSEFNDYFKEYEVVSVEEALLEDMLEFNSYDRKFKGFIDLVIKTPDGKYHIIDWKTCSWGWPTSKKSDPIINYQLTYYKNYFQKKHNIPPEKIETYFALLKRTSKKENLEMVRITSGRKKIQNSLKVLQNAVINIERGNYIKNRLNCKYCKFYKTEHCQ